MLVRLVLVALLLWAMITFTPELMDVLKQVIDYARQHVQITVS